MHPGPLQDGLTVVAGLFTGAMSAAFGIGGAVVSTPAVRALGLTATLAIGTTLPSILPGAVVGTARYMPTGLIRWRVVAWTVPAGMGAAVAGSFSSRAIPGHGRWLMVLTAALLAFTSWRIFRQSDPERPVDPEEVSPADAPDAGPPAGALAPVDAVTATAPTSGVDRARAGPVVATLEGQRIALKAGAVGILAGFMSGLLGIGGGIVMVPGFTQVLRLTLKETVATSLVCVGVLAVPSTITHGLLGDIDWRIALLLTVGVLPGARVGARLAISARDHRLRVAVAGFLAVVAVVYGGGELHALFSG